MKALADFSNGQDWLIGLAGSDCSAGALLRRSLIVLRGWRGHLELNVTGSTYTPRGYNLRKTGRPFSANIHRVMSSFATQIGSALAPLADTFDGHHDWGGGWWIVMAVGMLAFWILVIVGGIWLVRELSERRRALIDARGHSGGG